MKTETEFVWYAEHPTLGELILAVNPKQQFKHGIIYSPKMLRERLPANQRNALAWLELALGPVGYISRDLYKEAGIEVVMPLRLRVVAMLDAYEPEAGVAQQHDAEFASFVLEQWQAQVG